MILPPPRWEPIKRSLYWIFGFAPKWPLIVVRPASLPLLRILSLFLLLLSASTLSACATRPPASDPEALAEFNENDDRLEPFNRVMFKVDQGFNTVFVHPVVHVYRTVVPAGPRRGLLNFANNLHAPVVFINDVLQARFHRAGQTLGRILLNTTVGLGGLFDVASRMGLPYHNNQFGTTLAVWGVGEGSYLYLPLLGPSTIRDGLGLSVDTFAVDPLAWYEYGRHSEPWVQWADLGLTFITQEDDNLDVLDELKKSSIDYYAALRSAYRQHRAQEIRGGKPPPLVDLDAPP